MRTSYSWKLLLRSQRNCNRILVLRDGIIAERGTSAELMRRNGVFAEFYITEFRDTEKVPLGVAYLHTRPGDSSARYLAI